MISQRTVDRIIDNAAKPQWTTAAIQEYPVNTYRDDCTYKFGDLLYYKSYQVSGLKTKCVFIRYENGKAVVMFENAEFAARVQLSYLERYYT